MHVQFVSLNSGSNANCYYVGTAHHAILIDAGLRCKEIEKRMQRLHLNIHKVKAIFISHEHSDHICGLVTLSKKYQLPVYITNATKANTSIPVEEHLSNHFVAEQKITIGDMEVLPFTKYHDAADPHSFVVTAYNFSVGIFTDIGFACSNVQYYFKQCNAVFLEANYCSEMLRNGRYAHFLKQRIESDEGHLSNDQALQLFLEHKSPNLSHLIMSHLSKNNNAPEKVQKVFAPYTNEIVLEIADRFKESKLHCLMQNDVPNKNIRLVQGSLF
jgi:phosphoribosyl 1,2-cyclic phosphodiesterase